MKTWIFLLLGLQLKGQNALSYPQSIFDADTCCWRALSKAHQYEEAARLILAYLDHNRKPANQQSLYWHAGQLFASAGNTKWAIKYFKKTYSIFYLWFGGEDGKTWYYYARGTIAFLEKDKKTLEAMIHTWEAAHYAQDKNYKTLIHLYNNWDKDYVEAANW